MKIAVTSENGEIYQHFGHTPEFTIFEIESGKILSETVMKTGDSGHGALADLLGKHSIEALVCGGIGGGAIQALANLGIAVIGGASGNVRKCVEGLIDGTLEVNPNYHCNCGGHHHDDGHECRHGNCHS